MSTAITLALDPEMLEDWAGPEVFDRGEQLLHAVTITAEGDTRVDGFVQGTYQYAVSFQMDGNHVQAQCSCPHSGRGFFCKHLVAFGLVVGGDGADSAEAAVLSFDDDAFVDPVPDHVQGFLDGLDREELYGLIAAARLVVPPFEEFLHHMAGEVAVEDAAPEDVEYYIRNLITDACRVGSFVDHYRAAEVAYEVSVVLEEMEACAFAGHQKILVKQSRRFVDRLSAILERTDDSDGLIGEVLDQASALHAFICTTGEADPNRLVDWIVRVQLQGPGWPEIDIADYWPILTDRAKQKYRHALETAVETASQDDPASYSRRAAAMHLVQFADASGDVDLAVRILSGEGNIKEAYRRLVRAERTDEAAPLFESMIGDWEGPPGYRLGAGDIVEILLSAERSDKAENFMRRELGSQQTLANYLLLVDIGKHSGRDLRGEALGLISDVRARQEVLMHEKDTEALWELVSTGEPTWISDAVPGYFERNDPDKAMALLIRLGTAAAGGPADKSAYKEAAGFFTRAKKINPASLALSRAIADVRKTHYRRTTMLKIFDQQGL